jgi:hypothetical protein
MPAESHRWDVTKLVRMMFREEVKTPLSFFFKVVPYLIAAWIAILYAPVSDSLKYGFFYSSAAILVGLCVMVWIFAWFKPKHLVYGESGHRAETKLEFGTEHRAIDEATLELLEKVQNPRLLDEGGE